ncbi:hypothetical protein F5Y05DRAFT_128103 [Hypoxylon sp. FL0543]|nr:hypothetical protein F5Y05DRAFT_128103 [Hypoxylon sp. FL0543]
MCSCFSLSFYSIDIISQGCGQLDWKPQIPHIRNFGRLRVREERPATWGVPGQTLRYAIVRSQNFASYLACLIFTYLHTCFLSLCFDLTRNRQLHAASNGSFYEKDRRHRNLVENRSITVVSAAYLIARFLFVCRPSFHPSF